MSIFHEQTPDIPFVRDIVVRNGPLPLNDPLWETTRPIAFSIRRGMERVLGIRASVDLTVTTRGILTVAIYLSLPIKRLLRRCNKEENKEKIKQEVVNMLMERVQSIANIVNLTIRGIGLGMEELKTAKTSQKMIVFYQHFCAKRMELKIYAGSLNFIDNAVVMGRKRSELTEETRNYVEFLKMIPRVIPIPQDSRGDE